MSRITANSVAAKSYGNLQASLARSEKLQEQLSSGKQLSRPADAPGQTAQALSLRTTEQYVRNADDGLAWLGTADTALRTVSTQLRRARELAVIGASTGSNNPGSNAALAAEVLAIRDSLVGVANTTYLGRPVFGGTVAGATAYAATPPPVTYVGDTGTVQRRIGPNAQVRADVPGPAVFGTSPSNVFDVLDTLADNLVNNPAAVGADIAAIDTAAAAVLAGARRCRIPGHPDRADAAAQQRPGAAVAVAAVRGRGHRLAGHDRGPETSGDRLPGDAERDRASHPAVAAGLVAVIAGTTVTPTPASSGAVTTDEETMTAIAEPDTQVQIPEICFVRPIPGLGQARRFALVGIDEAGVLYSMQSLDAPDVRLVVAAPAAFFPQYAPEIDEQSVSELGLATAEDVLVLVVVTVARSLQSSTANLLAPIVIHRDTRVAVQVVLSSSDLPLRAPLAA